MSVNPIHPIVHMVFHKPIRIYLYGGLILGVNTLYRLFYFKLLIIGGKGLSQFWQVVLYTHVGFYISMTYTCMSLCM